jgi:hypothetical protein
MKPKSRRERRQKKSAKPVAVEELASSQPSVPFPIVGIGASAGGLEALEHFLAHVPGNSGIAFVIVQHLDPTREGVMPELLQRTTSMKVFQVEDRTKVLPDCVYVIPPNKDMSILHGVLHLLEPVAPRGMRLPIDFFLRSLALDQQDRSIGVILSGMGSDGTLGLRAIKEKAGVVLVQEPATAKFDSMPRSAIDAGLADIVAPADELPGRIMAFLRHAPLIAAPEMALEEKAESALEKVIILLRAHSGHDFSLYKKNTFYRRIERRMGIHQIGKIADYVRYVQENSQELDLLFKELLIGVTSFFRDPEAWGELREKFIPPLLAGRAAGHLLRVWVPGCSTGEEAYSIAMVIKEAMEKLKPMKRLTLQVFATDLDRDAEVLVRIAPFDVRMPLRSLKTNAVHMPASICLPGCHRCLLCGSVSLPEGEQQRHGGNHHAEHDPLHISGCGDIAHERIQHRRFDPFTEDRMGTRYRHKASFVKPGGEPRWATPPCVRLVRPRAALSPATTTPGRCVRRPHCGGTVWPRRRRPRHSQSGLKTRGAWKRHGMGRRQRWSRPPGRALCLARLRQTVLACVRADRSSGVSRLRHFPPWRAPSP